MAQNPFTVQPSQGLGRTLSGFGEILQESRERKRGEAGKLALQEAWKTQDRDALSDVAVQYPDLAPQVKELSEMSRFLEKDNLRSMALGAEEILAEPDLLRRGALIQDRAEMLESQGRDGTDTLNLMQMPLEEQEKALQNTIRIAERFGALDRDPSRRGLASAKTEIYNDGTVIQAKPGGGSDVFGPSGDLVTGQDRTEVLKKAQASGVTQVGREAEARERGKQEVRAVTEPGIQKDIALSKVAGTKAAEDVDLLGNMEASLPRLKEVTTELSGLINDATFTLTGKAWNAIAKEAGYSTKGGTARARMESIADNEILPLLRQTFGSAFTEGEGARLRATLVNPDATPEAKMASLESFIAAKEGQIRTLKRKIGQDTGEEYPEGTIISNAQNQRMQMTNGQWVPL